MSGETRDPRPEANPYPAGLESMQLLSGLMSVMSKAHSPLMNVASLNMSSMLANRHYIIVPKDGESAQETYAREACDYAEALLAEVHRREDKEVQP